MVEIASLPPSPLGPELSSLANRDERGRKGDRDVVPFGQLVSAQARPAHAQGKAQPRLAPREAPAPLDRPVEKAEKPASPPNSRASREDEHDDTSPTNARPAEEAPAAVSDRAPASESESRETSEDVSDETSQQASQEETEGGETSENPENSGETPDAPVAAPAEDLIELIEALADPQAESLEASAELPVQALATPVAAPADLPELPAGAPVALPAAMVAIALATEAEGAVNPQGSVASATLAPATTLPSALPLPAIATEAPTPSAAEAFAKLTARAAETPVGPRAPGGEAPAKGPAAPDLPKANFGDWIHDFALSQGAHHRSGDLVGSLDRALAALPTPHAGQDALRPTPLQMLPIEIGMQAMRGVTKFQIRLDPAELGRVDVKLEIREDGQVKANLVVDRVETLAMLKRDAQTLQQAFEQAGLRQSPDGLQFSLRGESQQREGQREGEARRSWSPDDEKLMGELPPELALRRVMIPNSSLDLMV
jgi:flagellar hook-length control protein FliK